MSTALLAAAVRNLPDEVLARHLRAFSDEDLVDVLAEILAEERDNAPKAKPRLLPPAATTPVERPRRAPKVKAVEEKPKHRESKRRTETTRGTRSMSISDQVAEALEDLGAKGVWVKCADLERATGLGANQVRMALYRLRSAGIAENNGERTVASRWRPAQKNGRAAKSSRPSKPAKGADEEEEQQKPWLGEPTPAELGEALEELQEKFDNGITREALEDDVVEEEDRDGSEQRRVPQARAIPRTVAPIVKPKKTTAKKDSHPPAAPVSLVVLPVGELTKPSDRFHCLPLSAKILASDCLSRQALANKKISNASNSRTNQERIDRNRMASSKCAACPLGRSVIARLDAVALESKKKKPTPAA
jgi:transposase